MTSTYKWLEYAAPVVMAYDHLAHYVDLLKNYTPPKDVYAFLVLGSILGFSTSYIYNHLTTTSSRQMAWNRFRKEYQNLVEQSKRSRFQAIKNRIHALFSKTTRTALNNYEKIIKDMIKTSMSYLDCLIKTGQANIPSTKVYDFLDEWKLAKMNEPGAPNPLEIDIDDNQQDKKVAQIEKLEHRLSAEYLFGKTIKH